jgi:hypothetical protein
MLTGPLPWSIPNAVILNGSIGSNPRLGTPAIYYFIYINIIHKKNKGI